MNDLEVDFVLVRGPPKINRRFHLTVPGDSTPVIIGRGLHCAAVLDPWLVFASHVQCSLFCVSPPVPNETYKDNSEDKTLSISSTASLATPRPTLTLPNLYILDMCSSNGTFVNNIRIGGIEPVLLKDGDSCIFGGMRDVVIGESLLPDAFDGPELCVWKVNILNGKDDATQYDYQPTPTLFPTHDRLEWEERTILETALRTMRGKHAVTTTSDIMTPGQPSTCPLASTAITPPPTVSHRLFNTPSTQLESESGQTDHPVLEGGNQIGESRSHLNRSSVGSVTELDEGFERGLVKHEEKDKTLAGKEAVPASQIPSFLSKNSAEEMIGSISNEQNEGSPTRSGTVVAQLTTEYSNCQDDSMPPIELRTNSCNADLLAKGIPPSLSSASMVSQTVSHPAIAYLRAVRLGRHTFHVQEENISDATASEAINDVLALDSCNTLGNRDCSCSAENLEASNTKATKGCPKKSFARVSDETPSKTTKKKRLEHSDFSEVVAPSCPPLSLSSPSPFTIEFTETHWKWFMDNPNNLCEPDGNTKICTNGSPSVFQCILPVSSIGAIFACKERMGIAIELKAGCQVPLVRSEVLYGGIEHRCIVWILQRIATARDCREGKDTINGKSIGAHKLKKGKKGKKLPTPKESHPSSTELGKEGISDVDFEAWLEQLEAFYNPYKVPPPHRVDRSTFDNLFHT